MQAVCASCVYCTVSSVFSFRALYLIEMSRKTIKNKPNYRPNRPRCGKQPSKESNLQEEEEEYELFNDEETSSSAGKMKTSNADITVNLSFCYHIIEFVSVFAAISDIADAGSVNIIYSSDSREIEDWDLKYSSSASAVLCSSILGHSLVTVLKLTGESSLL